MADDLTTHDLTRGDGAFRVVVLGDEPDRGGNPPCAAVFGQPTDGCLIRIHSRCLYSECFGSVDCDCQEQLRTSMAMMRAAGTGVLVYLDQEGRGAGLLAKARGYEHTQRTGDDTFASYRHLGLPEDSRSYDDAVRILRNLGLRRVTLLTNNPAKVEALRGAGIAVTQRTIVVEGLSDEAQRYLRAKAQWGHTITLPGANQSWFRTVLARLRRRRTDQSGDKRSRQIHRIWTSAPPADKPFQEDTAESVRQPSAVVGEEGLQ